MNEINNSITVLPSTRRALLKFLPAAAVAVTLPSCIKEVKAAPATAQQLAKYHYEEMAKALNDLTADTGGWILYASEKQSFAHLIGGRYTSLGSVTYRRNELGQPSEQHFPMMGVL
jgi:hypothetical protein